METAGGPIVLSIRDDGQVTVDMGEPRFVPEQIPFQADAEAVTYPLAVGDERLEIAAVSMGNPHCVTLVEDVQQYPVERLGPLIEQHPRFPRRVNAGLEQQGQITAGQLLTHLCQIHFRRGRCLVAVGHAQTAAKIQMANPDTRSCQFVDQCQQALQRVEEGGVVGQLRADVTVHTLHTDVGKLGSAAVHCRCAGDIDTELVFLQAGRDVGMGLCIHVGVHPQ